MPRIRKKTSNRQNTRDKAKITKHVAEHKKKTRKASKKDVTWKSKKKPDLGVPNTFIHKDKVLAEMAAEKRQEEEARLARREAAKAAGQGRAPSPEEEDTPGIQSILTATVSRRSKAVAPVDAEAEEDEDVEIPDLVDTSLTTLQEVLDKADVVVEVVDARDIAGGRSKFIEDLVKESGGKIVLLVNKIDRVPRETLQSWLKTVSIPTFLFKSVLPSAAPSTSSQLIEPSVVLGKTELLEYLSTIKPAEKDADLSVALMGLPNVGKTSVLNSLLPPKAKHHETAPVLALNAASKNPQPTTKMPSENRIEVNGKGIKVIDTPGWDFADEEEEEEEEEEEDEDEEADEDEEIDEEKLKKWDQLEQVMTGDLLRRNLGRVDRIKDIIPLANFIVSRSNAQDLMVAYNIPYFNDGDTMAFLTSVARSTGRLRKGNQPDLESAAKHLVRDWAQNTFPYYSTPKSSTSSSMDVDSASQPDMSAVLEKLSTRKEMRKVGKGVIRFKGGDLDEREVILDDDFTAGLAPSDDEDEEEDDDEEEEGDDDDDEEDEELEVDDLDSDEEVIEGADFEVESADEEEDEESESEPEPEPVSRKLKRKADPVASPGEKKKPRTHKRVSFGGKLGATGSKDSLDAQAAKEVKSILKRKRESDVKAAAASEPEAGSGTKAKVAKGVTKTTKPPIVAKVAAPAPAVNGNGNGKSKKVKGTYDFAAHF